MRVAFLLNEYPSRSETFVRDQISGLMERGHDVHVFTQLSDPALAEFRQTNKVVLPASLPASLAWIAAHPRAIVRALSWGARPAANAMRLAASHSEPGDYDVIHCHFGPNGIIGGALRKAGAITGALVVTFHGYDLSSVLSRQGRDFYDELKDAAELLLPVTERWRQLLLEIGCAPERVRVHRMGIDTRQFTLAVQNDSHPIRLFTAARFVEKKGLEYAIRGVAAMPESVSIEYTIAGDGPLRPELQRLTHSLGVSHRVRFAGWATHDDVRSALLASQIAVIPSVRATNGDEEGLPVFLMEAMAAGLAVVATAHSGIPELIRHDLDGLLVPERDPTALADALMRLVDSATLRSTLGQNARSRVAKQHDIDRLNDELVGHYHEAIRMRGAGGARGVYVAGSAARL